MGKCFYIYKENITRIQGLNLNRKYLELYLEDDKPETFSSSLDIINRDLHETQDLGTQQILDEIEIQ